ncbi:helix-turn-helix transcriptional regulator [Smaragdicoccus niigatensis]|uniref:helix-turn-helix transcriptional regulator n=1 Tax=Smaragdicoccus niigatensis TaxID=359359 RepID=UPI00037D97D8|nr:response regulator transcription factor [Smaragdicoccus niigatensis]
MEARVNTFVYSTDPILRAGVESQLRMRAELAILKTSQRYAANVSVLVADVLDAEVKQVLTDLARNSRSRKLLVLRHVEETALISAAEDGVNGVLRRNEATSDALTRAILRLNRGEGVIPADLLGTLLNQVGRLQRQVLTPRGLSFTGLTDREVKVLRLVAEGHDTSEIAAELSYSQRTVKNVLHDVTTRLQLRNRSHAVAYAMREGLI